MMKSKVTCKSLHRLMETAGEDNFVTVHYSLFQYDL